MSWTLSHFGLNGLFHAVFLLVLIQLWLLNLFLANFWILGHSIRESCGQISRVVRQSVIVGVCVTLTGAGRGPNYGGEATHGIKIPRPATIQPIPIWKITFTFLGLCPIEIWCLLLAFRVVWDGKKVANLHYWSCFLWNRIFFSHLLLDMRYIPAYLHTEGDWLWRKSFFIFLQTEKIETRKLKTLKRSVIHLQHLRDSRPSFL